jgi:hypothetical protein
MIAAIRKLSSRSAIYADPSLHPQKRSSLSRPRSAMDDIGDPQHRKPTRAMHARSAVNNPVARNFI